MFAVALLEGWRPPPGRGTGSRTPVVPAVSRGRQWDLLGLQVIHPGLCSAPGPRSNRCALALAVTSMLPPLAITTKASDDAGFGARSRSFGTCSPTLRVSCCHSRARLASGWLAGLYREGVEPSGSLRKVSDHMVIPLSCPPDATHVPCKSPAQLHAASMPDAARAVSGIPRADPGGRVTPRF